MCRLFGKKIIEFDILLQSVRRFVYLKNRIKHLSNNVYSFENILVSTHTE